MMATRGGKAASAGTASGSRRAIEFSDDENEPAASSSASSSKSSASTPTPQSKAAATMNQAIRPAKTLFKPQPLDNIVAGVRANLPVSRFLVTITMLRIRLFIFRISIIHYCSNTLASGARLTTAGSMSRTFCGAIFWCSITLFSPTRETSARASMTITPRTSTRRVFDCFAFQKKILVVRFEKFPVFHA